MKYVFLTYSMAGVTGAPSYVNNKVKWLNEKSVNTVVFDHYGSLELRNKVVLDYLLPFKNNRFLELFFPPSYFTERQQQKVLERLVRTIGTADDYVVESNSPRLALWGELLSKELHAKHLILIIGEHVSIRNVEEFRFMEFKLNRKELFTIKPRTIQIFFKGYKSISDEDANDLFFGAAMGVRTEDVPMPELDHLPKSDYRILSFGRYKPYFHNMFEGVAEFAGKHSTKIINFLLMGDVFLSNKDVGFLKSVPNLNIIMIPSKRPVPQAVFDYSDVVIATSGCANLSYRAGAKTISMDVEYNQPLGIMGYNTIDSVYSTDRNHTHYDLCDLLDDVLVKHLFEGDHLLEKKPSGRGFDFQMRLINDDRSYWAYADKIVADGPLRRIGEIIVLRCGAIRLFSR